MKKIISNVWVLVFIIGLIPVVARARLVACVGDSITYGYGIPNRNDNSYPAQLARMLRRFDIEWETQNFGANGATLLRNGDQPYIRKGVYNPALASAPEVVMIVLGTNDSWPSNWAHKGDFISDYLALIDAFAELPSNPKIFICCPPPIWGRPWGLDGTLLKGQIIPLIGKVAELRDVGVIDLHTPLEDSSHLFPDGVHPNTEGAGIIAEIVASMILGFRGHPDLNSDGTVDSIDMSIMVDYWHTDNERCDIAPPPFGDGIVDVQDLIRLSEHLFTCPGAVAYWKLDETEGDIVYDSAAVNDAVVFGDAIWRPDSGMVGGAVELDGVDDFISAPAVLNPPDGPFSVLAWVKGGGPGQVIISGSGGSDWLSFDLLTGSLMTDLKASGRGAAPLLSQTVITDGNWHRIALVWDGSYRTLYVDDLAVAEDTQNNLQGSASGLYVGCGDPMQGETFFSGMIDDIRIYNRVVRPQISSQ